MTASTKLLPTGYTEEYLGETLFHFWHHEPEDRAFAIFQSISTRGLLLTRGTKDMVDRFVYIGANGQENAVHITQKSRVCFTDIPEDKLSNHTVRYGHCGIGFARRTLLHWGGLPVLYLPNHAHPGTLQEGAAAMLYYLELGTALLQTLPKFFMANQTTVDVYGRTLDKPEAERTVELSRQSIYHIMSYVKEMSGKDADDHRFLYEREWRLVSGISNSLGDAFRILTPDEREELCTMVPSWRDPLQRSDGHIPTPEPLVNSFHFFNGIPGQKTVAQLAEVIIVPTAQLANRVQVYVSQHEDLFRPGGPEISVLLSS